MSYMLIVIYAKCQLCCVANNRITYGECRYATCRYAECRGAVLTLTKILT